MKTKIRAIYIGDVSFDTLNIFELNEETDRFEMLSERGREDVISYDKSIVIENSDFLVFEVKTMKDDGKYGNEVTLIN